MLHPRKLLLVRTNPYQTSCRTLVYVFLGHPHREQWHQMGARFKQCFHLAFGESVEHPYTPPPHGTCRVQAVRSVSDWSHGVLTEHSIQNACTFTRLLTRDDEILMGLVITGRHSTDSRSKPLHLYRYVPALYFMYSSPFIIDGRNVRLMALITNNRESVLVRRLCPVRIKTYLLTWRATCSISNTREEGPVKNQVAKALVERIIEAAQSGKKFKVSAVNKHG